jgi:hypothetical protein
MAAYSQPNQSKTIKILTEFNNFGNRQIFSGVSHLVQTPKTFRAANLKGPALQVQVSTGPKYKDPPLNTFQEKTIALSA